ncbi:hypothetical protein HQ520_14405 [bacterium]|nr:hypothetical protein [bacterium]
MSATLVDDLKTRLGAIWRAHGVGRLKISREGKCQEQTGRERVWVYEI